MTLSDYNRRQNNLPDLRVSRYAPDLEAAVRAGPPSARYRNELHDHEAVVDCIGFAVMILFPFIAYGLGHFVF